MRPPAVPPLLRNVHPPARTHPRVPCRVPALAHALAYSMRRVPALARNSVVGRARFELAVSWSQTNELHPPRRATSGSSYIEANSRPEAPNSRVPSQGADHGLTSHTRRGHP